MHQAYVFDAYGTLFDVHSAVRAHAEGIGPDHAAFSETWRQKQLEFTWIRTMVDRYVDFWDLTVEALDYAFEKHPSANQDARQALLDSYWQLDCFDEVPSVLAALKKAGARVGILSNGSPGMLDAAVKSAGLSGLVDDVISVDRIKRFKAMPDVYQLVLDDYEAVPNAISFQSSNRWDVAASKNFGFRTVWCNRSGAPDEYRDMSPDITVSDLNDLIGDDGTPI